jgi:SET domain-containing protein
MAPSFLNHSCTPNAHRSFYREDSSVMFVKAARDITENEQVTISYVDLLETYDRRSELLKQRWNFECGCLRC